MAFTDGNIIIGTSVDVGGIGTGLTKIEKSFKRLGKFAAFGLGIKALSGLGKAALDAASDLQEVQNVVDVSFRELDDAGNVVSDMTYKIEGFAQTCIEKFGMSEFAAKQTAGSFMAMGKSMGLSMEEASDMAVTLTGLTGDFSSFYNISQDYARVAMSAVYTGETETLKRYGIVLTEANLQQYAQSKGIETTVKKMDARDKAILRYMYIMDATKDMEGDFVRTQDSWANSTRVLAQLWNQFLISLGSGLISILSPMVQVLGQIVQRLTAFVTVLWQALSNIFGFQLQDITKQASGAAGAVGGLSDSTDELGESIDKAGKKAKKQLANFDELNNITTHKDSGSGGGGVGLSVGDMGLDTSGLWDPTKKDSPWSDIDNLYDLGKWIGDKLSDMMESIDWEKIYRKARGFGVGLATFLNGLISTDLFKDVGHTIASALNTAIYSAISFGATFDWQQFGEKLAAGVNEFFTTFDFAALADSINKWVQGIWRTIVAFFSELDYKEIFNGIKEFFTSLDPETVMILAGFIFLKKLFSKCMLQALTEGIAEGIGVKSLGSILSRALGQIGLSMGIGISNLGSTISFAFRFLFTTVSGFITQTIPSIFTSVVSAIGNFFTVTIPTLASSVAGGFATLFHNLSIGNSLNASMTYAFGGLATTISGIVSIIGGAVLAVKSFFDMWNSGWSVLKTILEAIGLALAVIGAAILGFTSPWIAIIAAITFGISQVAILLHDNWESVKAWALGIAEWIKTKVIDPVVSFFEGLFLRIGQFAEGCWIIIQAIWIVVSTWFSEKVIHPIINFFHDLWNDIKKVFYNLWEDIKAIWSVVSTWFNTTVIQPIVNFFSPIVTKIAGFFSSLWNRIKSIWGGVVAFFTPIGNAVIGIWNTVTNSIRNAFTNAFNAVSRVVRTVFNGISSVIQSVLNGIINGINRFLSGFNSIVSSAAKITGSSWGGVSLIPNVSLPRLAKGAVIPPNKEFLAVLGDQSSGTNIEAPLDTIKQALAEVMATNGGVQDTGDIVINIDGNEIFRVVRKQSKIFTKSTGVPAF